VSITGVLVANLAVIGHDCRMESTSEHNPSPLIESTPKHESLLGRVYEWFLELPVPIVLAVMWLAGVALIGLCVAALYSSWLALGAVAGVW
jgi:hypothetical protein